MFADFESPGQLDHWIHRYLELKREEGPVVFLDSQLDSHASSTFGYIASEPVSAIRIRDRKVWYDEYTSGEETDHSMETGHNRYPCGESDTRSSRCIEKEDGSDTENAWDALQRFREVHRDWMFGWLGYDLKNDIEPLESKHDDPVALPDLFFFVPATLLRIDRKKGRVYLVKGGPEALDLSIVHPTGRERVSNPVFRVGQPESGLGWNSYRDKVLQIKERIARGDTYEVNLTHQLQAPFSGDPLELFASLRDSGSVPFAAWIHYRNVEVCCASPERFLQRQGSRITSQPIKGTSARGATMEEDRRIVQDILRKEKNRAENVMIVDLVRHDLGQVAQTGTVRVDSLLEVQTFSTVHQLVSTVSADLKPGIKSVEVLKACFPMGSMTGAPKIRTMQIIEELENYRRGLYSGAIGYFTPEDDFDFNVVIRTAIISRDRLFYSVGGAVTSDSDPQEEWEETWLKSKALPQESVR